MSTAQFRARDAAPESLAADILQRRTTQANAKKATATKAKRSRKTPEHLQSTYVGNEDVHVDNESARQMDSRTEIHRESELPTEWHRPSVLDAPPPRPGFVQKWGRYKASGSDDSDNYEKLLEEGWRPRLRQTAKRGHALTADPLAKSGQHYVKRGLILLELPERLKEQRDRHYRGMNSRMTESIDRDMFKLQDHRMPFLTPERKTRVTTRARKGRLEDNIPGDEE